MQKTAYSAPSERLAGSMSFQGLRKPQALPGARLRATEEMLIEGTEKACR